ncbi:MAG: hypothetical protein IKT28_04535 [Rikenellaceae bacterium]|nr:hypothetical protein [Rikenellaceae bacterium]
MKKFSLVALFAAAVVVLCSFAQPQQQKINIQIPPTGFPVAVQQLPAQAFPPTLFLFVALDMKNRVAPDGVEVELKGKDFSEKFKLGQRGAQKQFQNVPADSVEITVTKAGYKTIKGKILIKEGPAAVSIRLDKAE